MNILCMCMIIFQPSMMVNFADMKLAFREAHMILQGTHNHWIKIKIFKIKTLSTVERHNHSWQLQVTALLCLKYENVVCSCFGKFGQIFVPNFQNSAKILYL